MLSTLRINATKINMSIRKATKFGFLVPVLFTAIISSVPMSLVKKKKKNAKITAVFVCFVLFCFVFFGQGDIFFPELKYI